MNRLFILALCMLAWPLAASAESTVLVTLKLVKTTTAPADLPVAIDFPSTCKACQLVEDPAYARQNTREVILAMRVPVSTPIPLRVRTDASAFRRVTLETVDLSFERSSGGLRFIVPSQIADRVNSGEFQTHLYWQGVELRLEHGDPARRAGDYTEGVFPDVQRRAASNLEFGLLEAIRRLGLDHYVDDQNLGRLFLMGFDTNYPHGHHDSPPHFHLALWLPNYRGGASLIPHFYLTPQGLIANSIVMPYDWPIKSAEYKAGESFSVTDMLVRPVYSLTITPEGWLNIARFDGAQCSLQPLATGFDSGVKVACPNFSPFSIQVDDDISSGQIRESIDGEKSKIFYYDPDTGALLQP
ncbi:hypothetical protein HNQ77_000931 [Silvibacterium bohemicum]|uniref:Uncharacterized protein n=1 Tax=Silvibacterium bohemicum TaxID=1577686 RepID=A0A841JR17_9BACT|nr:hypothetical protein [Silvibacterium bohemicum]MBB6142987.1 hypothetical protein [Silvibacterium bohemicum]